MKYNVWKRLLKFQVQTLLVIAECFSLAVCRPIADCTRTVRCCCCFRLEIWTRSTSGASRLKRWYWRTSTPSFPRRPGTFWWRSAKARRSRVRVASAFDDDMANSLLQTVASSIWPCKIMCKYTTFIDLQSTKSHKLRTRRRRRGSCNTRRQSTWRDAANGASQMVSLVR